MRPADDRPTSTGQTASDPTLASFEQAVQAHSRTLWSVAAGVLGRRDGAEDVVQEAVIVALGKKSELSKVENFVAWMAQIVRFVALNRRRSNKIRAADGEEALMRIAADEDQGPRHDRLIDTHGRLHAGEAIFDDHVLKAVNALDETPRACLLLRVLNDMSYKEIGQVLQIPEGTAMSHVFRARKLMMERLGPSFADSEKTA
jgi:RNA polymerase sigma-70 factor (ECF subfamily)